MNHLLSYFVLCRCPVAEHPADVLRLVESRSGQQHPLTGLIITNVCKQNQGNPFCVPPTAFREETCDTALSAFAFPPPADSKKSMSVEALALFFFPNLFLNTLDVLFHHVRVGGEGAWSGQEAARRNKVEEHRLLPHDWRIGPVILSTIRINSPNFQRRPEDFFLPVLHWLFVCRLFVVCP